jgi:hypothetical protein
LVGVIALVVDPLLLEVVGERAPDLERSQKAEQERSSNHVEGDRDRQDSPQAGPRRVRTDTRTELRREPGSEQHGAYLGVRRLLRRTEEQGRSCRHTSSPLGAKRAAA